VNSQLRQLLHAYSSRRSPWGPSWWVYGVAFGAVNLIRQAVIILTPTEIPQSIRVASYLVTALAVVVVINGIAVTRRRRRDPAQRGKRCSSHRSGPSAVPRHTVSSQPNHQPNHSAIEGGHIAMKQQHQVQETTSTKWAPWWLYLVIIVGANYLRRAVLPDGSTPAARVVLALAVSTVLFVATTIIYRATVRGDGSRIT
jgi:hypothetical protein